MDLESRRKRNHFRISFTASEVAALCVARSRPVSGSSRRESLPRQCLCEKSREPPTGTYPREPREDSYPRITLPDHEHAAEGWLLHSSLQHASATRRASHEDSFSRRPLKTTRVFCYALGLRAMR